MGHRINRTEIIRLGQLVANDFTADPRFTFLGFAGLGRHGGTLILSERASPDQEHRKIVIKYSYGSLSPDNLSDSDEQLRNEYGWLEKLRGAEHIVQLVTLADRPLNIPGISNGDGNRSERDIRGRNNQRSAPSQRTTRICPTFALEYLSGGTLRNFRQKLGNMGQLWLPNRLLWRIWLCMVRQCIAMAFPPAVPEVHCRNGAVMREVIREGIPYTSLTQGSPHEENYMFDTFVLQGDEHEPHIPTLKLIDFGRAEIEDEALARRYLRRNIDQFGSILNLSRAAWVFMPLCSLYAMDLVHYELLDEPAMYTWTTRENVRKTVRTTAPAVLRYNSMIDPQLRHMLVRLFTVPMRDAPRLSEILHYTEQAVRNNEPRVPPPGAREYGILETDEAIKNILDATIYNVD